MQGVRNAYRDVCNKMNVSMVKPLLLRFIELESLLLAPIVPHFSDHVWREYLHKTQSMWHGAWPTVAAPDPVIARSNDFVKKVVKNLRETVSKKPKKAADWKRPNKVSCYCAREYHPWQQFVLRTLRTCYEANQNSLPANVLSVMKETVAASEGGERSGGWRVEFKKQMKDILAFASFTVKTDFPQLGEDAFTLGRRAEEERRRNAV